jgi:putative phage-type endonuclease
MVSFVEPDSDEYYELQCTVSELIDEYISNEILHMSSPDFYNEMLHQIVEVLYEQWTDAGICEKTEEMYEEIEDFVDEVTGDFFENYDIPPRQYPTSSVNEVPNIENIEKKMIDLKNAYQPAQKSQEWYEYRHSMITASNIWKVFGSESQYNSIIYEKCVPFESGGISTSATSFVNTDSSLHWGVKYEPVSIMLYEQMYGTVVDSFGCIQHPKYKCIGASPDGIVNDTTSQRYGRMLEIKNIVNREITGIPKEEYWIQMQVQLETCDLDECDFLETRFKEYENESMFYSDIRSSNILVEKIDTATDAEVSSPLENIIIETRDQMVPNNTIADALEQAQAQAQDQDQDQAPESEDKEVVRGIILHFIKNNFIDSAPYYLYMPLDIAIEKDEINEWIKTKKNELKSTYALYKVIYWYLDEYSCILVKRNRKWFSAAVPKIEEAWATIEKERISGYEHRASKKRTRSENIAENGQGTGQGQGPSEGLRQGSRSGSFDESKTIKNIPFSGGICLIKLDHDIENAAQTNEPNNI